MGIVECKNNELINYNNAITRVKRLIYKILNFFLKKLRIISNLIKLL